MAGVVSLASIGRAERDVLLRLYGLAVTAGCDRQAGALAGRLDAHGVTRAERRKAITERRGCQVSRDAVVKAVESALRPAQVDTARRTGMGTRKGAGTVRGEIRAEWIEDADAANRERRIPRYAVRTDTRRPAVLYVRPANSPAGWDGRQVAELAERSGRSIVQV